MIKSVTVTNQKGESLTMDLFNPEESGVAIRDITGLGPPNANIGMTELTTTDGSIYFSSRIPSRNIVLNLIFLPRPDIESVRHNVYRFFPIKKQIELVVETDYRKLKAFGYVEHNEPDIFSQQEGAQVSIMCPDPFFYDVDQTSTEFSTVVPVFEFPFSNESLTDPLLEFGAINIDTRTILDYTGDVDTGVLINLHFMGEVKNVTIYNVDTLEAFSIDTSKVETIIGRKLKLGDDINISTISGHKYVQCVHGGVVTNVIAAINKDADWFTISAGRNTFNFTTDEGTENLIMTFFYNNAYGGI